MSTISPTHTPSASPPRTPDDPHHPRRVQQPSTPNSDDSIEDLSFDYGFNEAGDWVRMSKKDNSESNQDNQSTPPTPDEGPLDNDLNQKGQESPELPASPMARVSLARSESAHSVLTGAASLLQQNEARPMRSFQRVASVPAGSSTLVSTSTPTQIAPSRSRGVMARRITMEDHRERPEAGGISRSRQTLELASREKDSYALQQEEKENILTDTEDRPPLYGSRRHSPPLVSRSVTSRTRISYSMSGGGSGRPLADMAVGQRTLVSRQAPIGLTRPGRMMKSSSSLKFSTSGLGDVVEMGAHDPDHPNKLDSHHTPAPSDTEGEDDPIEPASIPLPPSFNPGSHVSGGRHKRGDLQNNVQSASLSLSGSSRPRRSASLSDALQHDDYQLQVAQPHLLSSSRPGTSLGNHEQGARRIHPEQRERQEIEARAEYRKFLQENEAGDSDRQQHSPSPTHNNNSQQAQTCARPGVHRRRDSDTLRGLVPPNSGGALGSPTVMDAFHGSANASRLSPTGSRFGRASPPATRGRVSPQTRGRVSPAGGNPPAGSSRASPLDSAKRLVMEREAAKHRRSPTAPDPSPLNGIGPLGSSGRQSIAKTWANGERGPDIDLANSAEKDKGKERERQVESERERRERREPQQQQQPRPSQLQPHTQAQQQASMSASQSQPGGGLGTQTLPAPKHIVVNKKAYARLDLIGKGGSSRVFRVLNHSNELFAIKRVSLDKTDAETMSGYMNEIALLKRLEGNNRIIRLIDSEVKPGPGGSKGHLLLVMECGEIDFSRLLQEQMKEPLNMAWVAYYWQQMLQAVHIIHEEKIVHSDLKPANFVLVRGQLKLIDFGIANAIANDTTNIQRDHQIGTVNYMSPEAIELPDGMRRLKVGRPSDVWSLGIILYQMVYGRPPFHQLSVYQKMKAIPDNEFAIKYDEYAVPSIPVSNGSTGGSPQQPTLLEDKKRRVRSDVIAAMQSCLCRHPKERATIPQLLDLEWLGLSEGTETRKQKVNSLLAGDETVMNPHYMRQLLEYGMNLAQMGRNMDEEALQNEAMRLIVELQRLNA